MIVFATLPAADFTRTEVLEWHRNRWQVELASERFESLAELRNLPKHDDKGVKAWQYGKLLVKKLIGHTIAVTP